ELPGTWMNRRELLSLFLSLGALEFGSVLDAQGTNPETAAVFQVKTVKGIDFVLRNSPTSRKHLIETMTGGVALLDYNNDGLLDIFLVNAGHVADPLLSPVNFDRDNPKYWNRLYRQNKDGTFPDVPVQAGLQNAGDTNYGMGVAVGDY